MRLRDDAAGARQLRFGLGDDPWRDGRVLGLLIAVGITDGTILGIAGSGVITATAWVIERRSF